uniref:Uncharacterized protein n=1 Tax=Myoviridae sp. ctNQV2 TaxID=2827683 RepID=A0A8S5S079_9CAUD|nr:MAG TPA: hypothetical protein [Myoviridae sp. ctNQV2]
MCWRLYSKKLLLPFLLHYKDKNNFFKYQIFD